MNDQFLYLSFFGYWSHLAIFTLIIGSWIEDTESITTKTSTRPYSKVRSAVWKSASNEGINMLFPPFINIIFEKSDGNVVADAEDFYNQCDPG